MPARRQQSAASRIGGRGRPRRNAGVRDGGAAAAAARPIRRQNDLRRGADPRSHRPGPGSRCRATRQPDYARTAGKPGRGARQSLPRSRFRAGFDSPSAASLAGSGDARRASQALSLSSVEQRRPRCRRSGTARWWHHWPPRSTRNGHAVRIAIRGRRLLEGGTRPRQVARRAIAVSLRCAPVSRG